MRDILRQENDLLEILLLVGDDSLSEEQKLILYVAKIIRQDFLQQNVYTKYDYISPLIKTIGMLKAVITFYKLAQSCIERHEGKMTLSYVKFYCKDVVSSIIESKRILPTMKQEKIGECFEILCQDVKKCVISIHD